MHDGERALTEGGSIRSKVGDDPELSGGSPAEHVVGVSSESIQCTVTQTCLVLNRLQRVYVEAGRRISASASVVATLASGFSFFEGTMNGYLVDVP
jgi:hypothetical protein